MITLTYTGDEKDKPAAVEAALDRFDAVLTGQGDEPMVRMERALVRTFILAALRDQTAGTSAPTG